MRSSNSLRVLPLLADVFGTGDFAVAAGVAASSASRALGRAEVAGLVIRVGNGTWVRCDDPAPVDWRRYPPEAARALWSPLLERVLDALYGDGLRRIGYLSGLAAAGEPMTVRPIVAADRHIGGRQARRLPFRHVRETVGCGRPGITAHAVRITERTWLSDPHRALLECAQFPVRAGNPEQHIAAVVTLPPGLCPADPARVAAIAGEWGWYAGLRRIASIAEGMAGCDQAEQVGVPAREWVQLAPAARHGDKWIRLNPLGSRTPPPGSAYNDLARKVRWQTSPAGLADLILN